MQVIQEQFFLSVIPDSHRTCWWKKNSYNTYEKKQIAGNDAIDLQLSLNYFMVLYNKIWSHE